MKSSKIHPDLKQLAFFFVYAILLIGLGLAILLLTSWGQFIGGFLVFVGIVVFVGKAIQGSGRAPCPECGCSLGDLQRKLPNPSVLCTACDTFSEGEKGEIHPIELDRIAAKPIFAVRSTDTIVWPEGCVVCRAKVEHNVEVKLLQIDLLKTLGRGMVVGAITGSSVYAGLALSAHEAKLLVPHCKDHSDGAKLQGSVDKKGIDIVFRSLAYQREFCELNMTTSAHLAHHSKSQGPLARLVPK